MSLSVVVPFHDVALYLDACLRSIAAQTYSDLEVVMVDDGSTDGSAEIAQRWAETDARFRYVRQDNAGPGPARNTGIARAGGELLAFVDGDDVVPRHTYQRMVDVLTTSGSDLVAGNARRFNVHGSTVSWSHRQPFATRRSKTHITRFSAGALDRMVWNKVYRRAFWDDAGLVFPAMAYEDYPVSLAAHLRATSIEVLEYPVYYWRERDAGSASITQSAWGPDNLHDRVVSAEMVLRMAAEATPAIHKVVQSHLLEVDLWTAARALVWPESAPHLPRLLALTHRLLDLFDDEALAQRQPIDRVLASALRQDLLDDVAALVDVRTGQVPGPPLVYRGDDLLLALPAFDTGRVPEPAYRLDPKTVYLSATAHDVRWEGSTLHVRLRANMAYVQAAEGAVLSDVHLRGPGGATEAVLVTGTEPTADGKGLMVDVEVDAARLLSAAGDAAESDWELWLTMTVSGQTRTGKLRYARFGPASIAPCWSPSPTARVQPGPGPAGYVVRVSQWRATLTDVTRTGDDVVVTGWCSGTPSGPLALLVMDGPLVKGAADVTVVAQDADGWQWRAALLLEGLVDHDRGLEPVLEAATFQVRLEAQGQVLALAYPLEREVARFVFEHREVQLSADRFQSTQLVERDAEFLLDRLTWAGDRLVVQGRYLDGTLPLTASLNWYHDPDHPQTLLAPCTREGERFSFEVDVAALVAVMRAEGPDDPTLVNEPGAWDVLLLEHGVPHAADLSMLAVRHLPGPQQVAGATVTIGQHRGLALRLVVALD